MNVRNARRIGVCVLLVCGWYRHAVAGEPPDLTLHDALTLATARNPAIAAFGHEAEAMRQQARAIALPPPASIDLLLENFAGTGVVSGTKSLEATLQFSKVLELGGKSGLRREVGSGDLARLDAAQRARRVDLLAEVARRFVHVLSDQEQLGATRRATTLAVEARDVVSGRVAAGATSPVALSRAEIALARARIALEHAEHELASSRVALSVTWGDAVPQFGETRGNLFGFPALEPIEEYMRRLTNNPGLLEFASEARLLDARARLVEAQRRPNVTFNVGIRHLEQFDEQALVAGVAVPFGYARRADAERLAVTAERERLALTGQTKELELTGTLFALYQESLHARTEAEALQNDIRPQAERMLRTIDEGYRAGRFSQLELADAQRQLLEIEQDAIRAAAEFHTNLIEIERLTGEPVHALDAR